ncbi:MAG: hypothetical protein QXF12_06855 [Candidatus Aenigmatarchaeota archaeon]
MNTINIGLPLISKSNLNEKVENITSSDEDKDFYIGDFNVDKEKRKVLEDIVNERDCTTILKYKNLL